MADAYLTISVIAQDLNMQNRVIACAAQQRIGDPQFWAINHSYQWASSPTWAEKWDYAVANNNPEPGADPAVITDGDILATVQFMVQPEV